MRTRPVWTLKFAALPLLLATTPAIAQSRADTSSPPRSAPAAERVPLPGVLTAAQREQYRPLFEAIETGDWAQGAGRLDAVESGPLHDLARAMLYVMPGSPPVESGPLSELLARAPELPQAEDLARLARLRGSAELPDVPRAQRLAGLSGQPRRSRARPIAGDPAADRLEPLVQPLLVADQPFEAESLFNERREELGDEARTAFRQRIAWVFYLNGHDREAKRIAEEAASGPTEWAIHAIWVAGLASWRMEEYRAAGGHFAQVASRSQDVELAAAGHYWTARAESAAGRPQLAQGALQAAARQPETFYGLLAQSALGMHQGPPALDPFTEADRNSLLALPNVRRAIALAELGQTRLADSMIRHQARIGEPAGHEALLHLAARLDLTATQMWLAHNGPRGTRTQTHDRYPSPSWRPSRGWRVDRALVFAHALQESNFRPEAVSPAGARGLMQVRPGTAGDVARARGESFSPAQLIQPSVNIEYGQSYLEWLRDRPETQGLLPRVIASYNAGLSPVSAWNTRFDQSDPLLFIESIPYWETRGYVPIVLRNYWIYEARNGIESPSRRALVAGLWPRFPGLPGPASVRIEPRRAQTAMGRD